MLLSSAAGGAMTAARNGNERGAGKVPEKITRMNIFCDSFESLQLQ
jgi:hypothetical protein